MLKVGFICVHNSCRSQIAEALGKYYGENIFQSSSAGTQKVERINQDAVRLMKETYKIDIEENQYSKLIEDLPKLDIVIKMGCNVVCPFVEGKKILDWGLEDPTGKSDEVFIEVIEKIDKNIQSLIEKIK